MDRNKHLFHHISFPSDQCLHHLFHREVQRNPDAVALVSGSESITYAQLNDRANKVAFRLRQLGVRSEDFVAIYLERSFDLITGIFGILKAGAAYVPIDVDYPHDRMAFMLSDAQARAILTRKSLRRELPETSAHIICMDAPEDFPEAAADAGIETGQESDSLAYMIYTSGSSGKPKGVLITHENVCNQLQGQQAIAPAPIGSMMLTCSISFDVSVLTIFWTLLQGAPLVLPPQGAEKDMALLADTIYRNKVTHILTLPSLYTLLLEQAFPGKLQSLRLVNVSGEVCPVSLAKKHRQLIPDSQLYNLYGPTEATVNCTCFTFPKDFNEAKAPIGVPILNYEIFILDEQLQEVPRGETGEIYIGGTVPVVGRGYWNRPELTAERFIPRPAHLSGVASKHSNPATDLLYKTGDLARWQPDGNIEFLGRSDFQVKYRGFRIELGEIETAIGHHPAVKETVVLLKGQHAVKNQKLVAYLTLNQGHTLGGTELRTFLEKSLPEYMVPSRVMVLDKMPLTTNGKFDRKALPEPSGERPQLDVTYEAPQNEIERYICNQWETILEISPVGRHDKFFELGGNSIQAAKFIGGLMNMFRSSVFITTIFEYPTPAAYASFLEDNYPENIPELTGKTSKLQSHESGGANASGSLQKLSAVRIAGFPPVIPCHLPESTTPAEPGTSAYPVFILAPPRSGTTLLRVMLAGHPELFACNELQLLHFETLEERSRAYRGKFSLWSEGLVRALMELKNCDAATARALLIQYEREGMSTREMFLELQLLSGNRTLVDKSPSYALDTRALQKAIRDFPDARFIQLTRHPYSMVNSFVNYHMDQVLYLHDHDYTPAELGELVWLHSHRNIRAFLKNIPADRQFTLSYEQLVTDPEVSMRNLCTRLNIPFNEKILSPYRDLNKKMTDGIHQSGRSMGDTNFESRQKIDPAKAEEWKGVLQDNFLCDQTWELAQYLGYEALNDKCVPTGKKSAPVPDTDPDKRKSRATDIAIIGMACRFPGANDIDSFWQNLTAGGDAGQVVTPELRLAEGLAGEGDPAAVHRVYAPDHPYCFDASFFGYHPKEAAMTDPQHRLFLETAYSALESAGYDPYRFPGKIGVFGGVARNTYFNNNICSNPELLQEAGGYQEMLAAESTFSISRVAYKLNLRGPAVNVQTACSTGGVAVHLACQSLHNGDSDMVIVGGGRIQAPVYNGYKYVEGGPLSPDATCRAFDAGANGMVPGHGMGMLILKRLDKAREDGDHIWAVIKATAINNDGADKTGITAPSSKGQAACITEALRKAGLSGDQIGYIEAHGTGTFIGDPIEIKGLTLAMGRDAKKASIPIGSVKTNIGHLDAGACIAGIIKTALALHREQLPPSLHFQQPNPQIDFEGSPFYVQTSLVEWPRCDKPRRAGISSFGLGGTNAHIILEEAPAAASTEASVENQVGLLPVSAKSGQALESACEQLTEYLQENRSIDLANAGFTLTAGRPQFLKKKVLLVSGDGEVKVVSGSTESAKSQRIAFMFPGGGAQYINMARDLYHTDAYFRKQVDECLDILRKEHGHVIREVMFPAEGSHGNGISLERPSYALPSLFTIEYSLARLWQHWGLHPDEMIGHSMGEYTAACLAGVMSLRDALGLVTVRGRLFESLEGNGCMLSVAATEKELLPLLGMDHTISVVNREDSLVVSSTETGVERLAARLEQEAIDYCRIHIRVPAHSPLIEPILEPFRKYLGSVTLRKPEIPFISNVTGTWITTEEATSVEYWISHIRQTVRFHDGLQTLINTQSDKEVRIFLEVGPGQMLSAFARAVPTLPGQKRLVLASVRHPREVQNDVAFIYRTLGKLWLSGLTINWANVYQHENRKRIPLPTYPFERTKHFVSPNRQRPTPMPPAPNPNTAMNEPVSRLPQLIDEIKGTLYELSGLEPAAMDEEASFLELGFDSLFLSQAVIKFNYVFKLKLSFRMLFEEAPTIKALATYIDGEIPPKQFLPVTEENNRSHSENVMQEPSGAGEIPVISPEKITVGKSASNDLQSIIQQQLQLMQQQLELLKNGKAESPAEIAAPAVQSPNATLQPASLPEKETTIKRSIKGVTAKMANYKKIGGQEDLSDRQRKGLEDFICRYEAMTEKSKDLAQRHRHWYADPRSVAGFSKLWKEVCYQISHEKSKGSKIWDVDNNEYVDYVMSYGVALFGHMPDFVEKAVVAAIQRGNSIDLLPVEATEIARIICELTGYDRATLSNTGTEAVMGAVRAARTITGRDRIAVFDTDYHGMTDEFLVRGVHLKGRNKTLPSSPGIPDFLVENTLTLDYDDPEVMQKLEAEISELAAVVIEPVQAQNPHWQHRELIQKVRILTEKHGVALIFDEVINGFRLDQRGAQSWFGVEADISAYGKSISGGLPLAAVAGKAKFMDAFDGGEWQFGDDSSPDGVITYFASTFIKNPVSVSAAHAAMREIERRGPALQRELNEKTIDFAGHIREIFLRTKAPFMIQSCSSFFMLKPVDNNPLSRLFHYFLRLRGVNVRERPCFISTAHTEADFAKTYRGFELAIQDMFDSGLIEPYEGEDLNVIVKPPFDPARQRPTEPLTVPLTEGQQEIFLSDQLSPGASKAYNIATEIRLEGPFDEQRMKTALQLLVDRHDALRTVISEDGRSQTILPEIEVEIPVQDLRHQPDAGNALSSAYDEEAEHAFNLLEGPLVRFRIIRLEDEVTLLFINVHHIICDGWSLGILTRELGELYRSGKFAALPPAKGLAQFAREQSELHGTELLETNEKYWLGQLREDIPLPDLPADHPRPAVRSFGGAVESISLDKEFVAALRKAAARRGTTFYVFMLAAFQTYLSRLTGQEDLIVGVAAAGHNLPGNDRLVAHAIGMLPVRVNVKGNAFFNENLKAVLNKVLDAFEHRQFTFGTLVKKLDLPRSAGRNTLVNVAFNQDSPLDNLDYGKLRVSTRTIRRHYEIFDTFINLKPVDERIDFEWNYNTDLFQPGTIRIRLAEFNRFLKGILEDAEKPVAKLTLLPDFENDQLTAFGQGETADFPLHRCLHELFIEQVNRSPEKTAVVIDRRSGGGSKLTYRELHKRSDRLARQLIGKGAGPGDFIGLCFRPSLDMIIGIYAIIKTGAAYVPVDPRNPQERVRFMLEDAGCRLLVTGRGLLPSLKDLPVEPVFPNGRSKSTGKLPEIHSGNIKPGNPAYVIYTSGSTGKPKGVVVRHENAINTLLAINRHLKVTENDTVFSVSSMSFDMSIPDYFLTLMKGATLVLAAEKTKRDGFALMEAVDKYRPTLMQATPTTWKILMLAGWKGSRELTAVAGGEGLSKELAADLVSRCKAVWNGYGPTETTIYATWQPVTEEHLAGHNCEFAAIGRPIANVVTRVLDKNGQPLPVGVPGELYIGGKGVSEGYLNRPALTQERFVLIDGQPFYRTGDLVRYLADGAIEFHGRIDDQVKIRGHRIELGEVEAAICQYEGVRQVAVNVIYDKNKNAQLAAYIVWKEKPDQAGLRYYLKNKLPGYMVPGVYMSLDALPVNASLKVDRGALPKPDLSGKSSRNFEKPRTRGEKLLTKVWSELLNVDNVSIHDDFFELGGHSLAAVELMARIREATNKKLPLSTLFQHSTIRKLATQLNGYNAGADDQSEKPDEKRFSSLICIRKGGDKPPFYLVHGGGLHVLFYQNLVKYLDEDQPIYALQAKGLNGDEEPHDRIEDMAKHYIREILQHNPNGVYCLAGYSLGGLIAWEMAARLKESGREVPLLALFDAVAKYEWAGEGKRGKWKKKLMKTGFNFSLLLSDPAKTLEYKSNVLKMQFQHIKGKLRTAYLNNRTNEIEEGYLPYGREVYEKSLEAYEKYELKPLDIHVDLFKAKQQMFYLHDPEYYGWDRFAKRGVTVHEIEGNHLTLFDDPNGREVARALKERLELMVNG